MKYTEFFKICDEFSFLSSKSQRALINGNLEEGNKKEIKTFIEKINIIYGDEICIKFNELKNKL